MEIEDVLKGISKYRNDIYLKKIWTNPVALSEVGVKLATYNSLLAEHIAALHRLATESSWLRFKKAVNAGETVTAAQAASKGDTVEQREQYENAKLIYSAVDKLISNIQTRIRTVENQITREGANGV